jgi:hypothetical protein
MPTVRQNASRAGGGLFFHNDRPRRRPDVYS